MEQSGSKYPGDPASVSGSPRELVLLQEKIRAKRATVCILGLGYVGLPLAVNIAETGFGVSGYDVDGERVGRLNTGDSYLVDVDSERLRALTAGDGFIAGSDSGLLEGADIFIICVPTPLTPNQVPDMSYLRDASMLISGYLRPGSLVILESTTYPGCTRDEVLPVLEVGGLRAGRDFWLAFSPERVDPGGKSHDITNTPKLVGGITDDCARTASLFYQQFVDEVVELSSAETAEMAKLLENVYRSVNIALVNELAIICNRMGVNVWEVINAAATKPFGYTPFYPGPGLGGHCIPIDPFYLSWKAKELGLATEFVELAGKVNTRMPVYVVERVAEILNERSRSISGSTILLIGAAYKADVSDMRESPALRVAELLVEKGATVSYHDPLVPSFRINGARFESSPLDEEMLGSFDLVLILTPHSDVDWSMVARASRLVLDTRNVVFHDGEKVFSI